jgi:pSer/pThr/pTyr-binding forkhead associated (FHA) protein
VSRRHARVERTARGCEIVDLDSANGLSLNGTPVTRARLRPGDVVTIGDSTLVFQSGEEDRDPELTPIATQAELDATIALSALQVHLPDTSAARLTVTMPSGTWEVTLAADATAIGRHPHSDVVLETPSVSRHHAVIERRGESFVIRDLRSSNGTIVRGTRVQSATLADGDSIDIGMARLVFKRGFGGEDLSLADTPPRERAERPAVVVVPGFGGSMLWRGSDQIWPAPRMLLTHPELLSIDEPLEARGLVNDVVIIPNLMKQDQYSALTDYLREDLSYQAGKDLLEFAYDFRQDNRVSARRLAAAIEAWDRRGPVTIVAHSMGCLIARYYVDCLGGSARVNRVIYLGAPHAGTPYAFASLLHGPGLLPLGLLNAKLRGVLASYPSWYQILPTYPTVSDQRAPIDLLADDTWLLDSHRPLVRNARQFRAELGARSRVPAVCVFGYGLKTITSASVQRESGSPCTKADFVVTPRGDGMIPEVSGVLAGAEIHPVKQHHGSLYSDGDVKMRLKLELTRGV